MEKRCVELRPLLEAALDGELDAANALRIEAHLAVCGFCCKHMDSLRALQKRMEEESLFYAVSEELEVRLQKIPVQERSANTKQPSGFKFPAIRSSLAYAAICLACAFLFLAILKPTDAPDPLIQEAIDRHLSALATGRLCDELSSDRHTVKPWFAGKLDFAPPVEDFEQEGFTLVGCRLDYLAGRPVAGLVYRKRKHLLLLYEFPARAPAGKEQRGSRQGYQFRSWKKNDQERWLISDINASELDQFEAICRSRL